MAGDDEKVLVDTSAWVELLRAHGDRAIRERLDGLLENDQAFWCDMVRLELWRGAGSGEDRGVLQGLEQDVPSLEITAEVWNKGCELAELCCRKGRPLPATDLIIFACSLVHKVQLLHRDQHFDVLAGFYPR